MKCEFVFLLQMNLVRSWYLEQYFIRPCSIML